EPPAGRRHPRRAARHLPRVPAAVRSLRPPHGRLKVTNGEWGMGNGEIETARCLPVRIGPRLFDRLLPFPIPHSPFPIGVAVATCLALYLLFFDGLADRDLWSSHEARAAMDAQSVLDGNWPLPHLFDGRAAWQKPPLYYWLVALTAAPGGVVDAWAVRVPSALAALGCVLVLGALGWRRGRPLAGVAAGMILATAVHFTWLARIGRIDMPLSLT